MPVSQPYVDDEPWHVGELERLGRRGYAQRIAQTIGQRRDPAGLVIALYGVWGEGKTSVLRMVEADLAAYDDVVVVRFNPWRFRDPDHLVEVFFATLADSLGPAIRLRTRLETFGEGLKKYGRLLRAVPYAGEVLEGAGEHIGEPALEELRTRLEDGIRQAGIRPVVIIDDMDRVERADEMSAVIRLVKLTAGFRNTTYLLAFDPDVVAGALSVGGAGAQVPDGRRYLEKIIQVPLQLPVADQGTLFLLMLENVNNAIRDVETPFPQGDQQAYVRYVRPLFHAQRRTIREAKRYANSVGFVLPLVAGEVNVGDLLLLEAIRAWHPEVHARLVEHRDILVGDELGRPPLSRSFVRSPESVKADWEEIVSGLDARALKAVTEALEHLFPFVQAITRRMSWGSDWAPEWGKAQRAASRHYFDRYFQYAVLRTDVGDRTVDAIERALASGALGEVIAALRQEADRGAATRLIDKLGGRVGTLTPPAAEALARAIAATGELYPASDDFFGGWISTEAAAARVVRWCIEQLAPSGRVVLALDLVRSAPSLRFAVAIFFWLRAFGTEREDGTGPLSDNDETRVKRELGMRLDAEHQKAPLYRWNPPQERRKLLEWWGITTGEEHTRSDLATRLAADPNTAVELLLPFRSHGWGMETGLPTPDILGENDYQALSGFVEPDVVSSALRQVYGDALGSDDARRREVATEEEAVAHQFAYQHRRASEIARQQTQSGEDADADGKEDS